MFFLLFLIQFIVAGGLFLYCCYFLPKFFVDKQREIKNKKFYYLFVCLFFAWYVFVVLEVYDSENNLFVTSSLIALFCLIPCVAYWLGKLIVKTVVILKIPLWKIVSQKIFLFICFAFITTYQVSLIFGIGYVIPDILRPSYNTQFKDLCKLNTLPDNEEKYNKILSVLGLSLEDLDNKDLLIWMARNEEGEYVNTLKGDPSCNIETEISIFTQQSYLSSKNIHSMNISPRWYPMRLKNSTGGDKVMFELDGRESKDCSVFLKDFGKKK